MVVLTDTSAHKKEKGHSDTMDLRGKIVSCENVILKERNDTRNKTIEVGNSKNKLSNMKPIGRKHDMVTRNVRTSQNFNGKSPTPEHL
jgi:hypothetical protein